jgi:hypothetical protein
MFATIIPILIGVLVLISTWKIFTKAGKPGWAILVPFYNVLVLLEIIGKPWWWLILIMFVPFANFVFGIWALNLLVKSFGKDEGFTVGIIFLFPIFIPILGLGDAEYKGPAGAPK